MKHVIIFSGVAFTVYAVICVYFYIAQESYIFFPSPTMNDLPQNIPYKDVYITTPDNETLHGYYADSGGDKTILYMHGNGGNISFLHNALLFDYRGYGLSSGTITQESDIYTDAESAYNFLMNEKDTNPADMIFWGHSLGGAVAIHLAQTKTPHAVIVESTFSSVDRLARQHYPYLPTSLILRYHINAGEKIQNITSKILIAHGTEDTAVPPDHAHILYKQAPDPKQIMIVEGAPHIPLTRRASYLESVHTFLSR